MNGECVRAQTLIQLLLDGRIDASRRQALDRHVATCPACAAAMDGYHRVSSSASEWARPRASEDPGAGFNDRLLKMLEAEAPPSPQFWARRSWRRSGLSILIAAVMAAAGGIWLANYTNVWQSISADVDPSDWMRSLAQIPDAMHEIAISAWSALDGLLSSVATVSAPNWVTEAGAAAIVVNAIFLIQAISNRRRQSA
jgi:anti-sigma factor RsiW